jgi:hypothetical protein
VVPLSSPHPVTTSTHHRSARRRPAWLFFFLLLSSPHSPRPCRVAGPSAAVLAKVLPCATSLPSVRVCSEPPRFNSILASPRYQHRALPLTPAPTVRAKLMCSRFYSGRPAFARSCCHSSRHTASAALRLVPALACYCRLSQRLMGLHVCTANHSRACLLGLHSTCARSLAPLPHPRWLPVSAPQPSRRTQHLLMRSSASRTPVRRPSSLQRPLASSAAARLLLLRAPRLPARA